jgi:hypothetical protein
MAAEAPDLTMEEIEARYEGEWVVIAEPRLGPGPQVLGGRVVFHHKDMDTASQAALRLCPVYNALFYIWGEEEGMPVLYSPIVPISQSVEVDSGRVADPPDLSREEIETQYDGEWVVIAEPRVAPGPRLLGGRVVFHHPDGELAGEVALQLKLGHHAIIFCGSGDDGPGLLF